MDNNVLNALVIHKAILEALISRLSQLEEILLNTAGVNDHDHEILERLHVRRACGTTQDAALPDGEPLRSLRSSDV
jgi:hypothetical protein